MTVEFERTQGFFDCTAGKNAFLAGCEVGLVGTQAVEITKGTLRDGKRRCHTGGLSHSLVNCLAWTFLRCQHIQHISVVLRVLLEVHSSQRLFESIERRPRVPTRIG